MDRFLAFGPIALSLGCITLVIASVAKYCLPPLGDEGTAAHIFQILMAIQLPLAIWFVLRQCEQPVGGKMPFLLLQALAWGVAAASAKLLT
ncbi:MAG: hypothetical protein M3Y18_00395 [Candidatus Eremiobacteraeota bacterium]|nr:hypothetical protein [Candidatus Eremiobacteraeota bacterium]